MRALMPSFRKIAMFALSIVLITAMHSDPDSRHGVRVGLASVFAQAATKSSNGSRRNVVVAPISTLGEEASDKSTRAVQKRIETGIGSVAGFTLISQKSLNRAVRKARRRDLRACDGALRCLVTLGKLVGADIVVYGELGGLGDVTVVYLKAIDVVTGKELRSTTAELSGALATSAPGQTEKAAAYRLLAPHQYIGKLHPNIDIVGASIYVDGKGMGRSPVAPITLSVGTHAVRITHPEYRDFVRFVDVRFDEVNELSVELNRFPIVQRDLEQRNGGSGIRPTKNVIYKGQKVLPWYRRWYTIAGAGTAVLIGSAILIGVLSDGIDFDRERPLGVR